MGSSTSSDVYALASILYSLLAGENAFVGPADYSVIPVIKRIASNPPPDLRRRNVPDPVADAVEKAMAKEASQRPDSARDFGRLLQQAQVALGLPMTEMTVLSPAGFPPRPAAPAFPATQPVQPLAGPGPGGPGGPGGPPGGPAGPSGPTPTSAKKKSSTPLIVGAVALVVLLAAGGLFFALSGGDDDPVETTTTAVAAPPIELTTVEDDTGVIEVDVPEGWDDVDGRPFDTGVANLRAGPDLDDFLESYDGSGIDVTAFAADDANALFDPASESELETFLEDAADFAGNRGESVADACDDPDRDEFDEGDLSGFVDVYTNCGAENTELVLLVASTDDESTGVVVLSILADGDEREARNDILGSIETSV